MANTAQARKRARQSVALNKHNSSLRSMLRTAIKRVRTAIESGDKSILLTPIKDSLEGHLMVFAAEESRASGTIVGLKEYEDIIRKSVVKK